MATVHLKYSFLGDAGDVACEYEHDDGVQTFNPDLDYQWLVDSIGAYLRPGGPIGVAAMVDGQIIARWSALPS
jgi:hypothetical protein